MNEADVIASVVLEEFDRLPSKRKPVIRGNGIHEWAPLSGIVAKVDDSTFKCLSMATGMKCLPANKLPSANGVGLHDWHAEILALRAFNYFVLEECRNIALHGRPSPFLRLRRDDEKVASPTSWNDQPFAWREDVSLHMYCSEAPCGDCSMELIMESQADASPWEIPSTSVSGEQPFTNDGSLPGRAYFSQLGIVRRKPARGDAQPTMSKSCSDKLAMKQCTSLLSSLASILVSPRGAYLHTLVLPESQYMEAGCARSFSTKGRMNEVEGKSWPGGYAFTPFRVETTSKEFIFSRRSVALQSGKTGSSNLAMAWSRHGLEESLLGGVLQGRKQFDVRSSSSVSRRRLWRLALDIVGLLGAGSVVIKTVLQADTYRDVKNNEVLATRRRVKDEVRAKALKGWIRNDGDSGFSLEESPAK